MAQLEELTDAASRQLQISDPPKGSSSSSKTTTTTTAKQTTPESPNNGSPTTTAAAAVGPVRPPGLALASGKTTAEILAELNKSPLFMTTLEENDDVAALQALAYEGTPRENAADFKERGNECFRERRWADAREFYDKGVLILAAEERRRREGRKAEKEGESDEVGEVGAQQAVLESLYVNRAAAHLELGNLRSVTVDCAAALRLNGGNVKALYRSGKALLALGKVEEAEDVCRRGLAVEEGNKALVGLVEGIRKRREEMGVKQRREDEQAAKMKRRALLLKAALRARGIRTRSTAQPPEMEDAKVQLVPDPDEPTSELVVPAVLLYPAHLQSDFIKAFNETENLAHHFEYIFPLPWDEERAYSTASVECYMETAAGGLIKVGKKMPLLQVLGTGKVEVVDDMVKFFVLPKAKAKAWVEEIKMKKAAEKK